MLTFVSIDSVAVEIKNNAVNLKALNSPEDENNPVVSADGNIIFFSSTRYYPERIWATENYSGYGRYDYDIYFSEKTDGEWGQPINLGTSINTPSDDAVLCISPDGNTIYMISFKDDWQSKTGPFYKAELRGTEWTNIEGLGGGIHDFFHINSGKYDMRVSGASISSSGNEFFFATNLNSKYGTYDIWYSRKENGVWSFPRNIGPKVNAKLKSNFTPFIAHDNSTLFFSSSGHGGYGATDIYFTSRRDNEWSLPINAGKYVNSPFHEQNLSVPASGEIIYLVSNREGGVGKSDIYEAKLPPEVQPSYVVLIKGKVFDAVDNVPIEAQIHVEDIDLSAPIYSTWSNSETGEYLVVLQSGRNYSITVDNDGYLFSSFNYSVPMDTKFETLIKNYTLQPLEVGASAIANNIFFEYNKATLLLQSKLELDRLITLLDKNPQMVLELSGHTDHVGSDDYNQKLSLDRSIAVKEYLVGKGKIEPERLIVIGYGETKPIATNATDEGRAKNRRTEFKVLAK